MAVPYVSVHARLLDQLAAHLAAGEAVRSLLGVETVEAARGRIIEIDGPKIDTAHLILASPRLHGFSRTAGGRFVGTALLGVLACVPSDPAHNHAEVQRAALNWYTPFMAWVAGFPRLRDIDDTEPIRLDASDGLGGWMMAGIDLTVDVTI